MLKALVPLGATAFEGVRRSTKKKINPYPANVDKMVGSCQCWQMADGI
jgi:hypothetical protein